MGLDQYAYIDPKEGARHSNQKEEDTFYWRKHSRLHEFMLSIWMEQNPDKSREVFNCRDLYLSEEIIILIFILLLLIVAGYCVINLFK
jgi:hypothetical protein